MKMSGALAAAIDPGTVGSPKIAESAGYDVGAYHDGQGVKEIYAICIPLPDDRAILGLHDPQTNWIYRLQIVENWSRPVAEHVIRNVDRFELPATRQTAR